MLGNYTGFMEGNSITSHFGGKLFWRCFKRTNLPEREVDHHL
jgi:hypothetical protein